MVAVWLLLAVFSAVTLSTTSRTLLPSCVEDIPSSFLLSRMESEDCGLPLSRSYIYSQFNSILSVEKVPSPILSDKEVTVHISACSAGRRYQGVLWNDNVSVVMPTPWDAESCNRLEVNFWARVISEHSIHPVVVRKVPPAMAGGGCMWAASFTPPKRPGEYRLEVLNHWLRGSVSSNLTACAPQYKVVWEGAERWFPTNSTYRGNHHTTCCDLCAMYEQCHYWTTFGSRLSKCNFFRDVKGTSARLVRQKHINSGIAMSGYHKSEPMVTYLGGITRQSEDTPEQCRQQAHVLNSPQIFTVLDPVNAGGGNPSDLVPSSIDSTSSIASEDVSRRTRMKCKTGKLADGGWVRLPGSLLDRCRASATQELHDMALEAERVDKEDMFVLTRGPDGGNCTLVVRKLHYLPKKLYFYASRLMKHVGPLSAEEVDAAFREEAAVSYQWVPPVTSRDLEIKGTFYPFTPMSTPPPQLQPACALSVNDTYPDSVKWNRLKGWHSYPMSFASYASPSQRLGGYEWASLSGDCTYFHYSRADMRQCFQQLDLQGLYIGGDSVIGGLYGMLSWMIGGLSNTSSLFPLQHGNILGRNAVSGLSTPPLDMELRELRFTTNKKGIMAMLSVPQDRPSVFLINLHIQHLLKEYDLDTVETRVHSFFQKFLTRRHALNATMDENSISVGKRMSRFHPKSRFVLLNSMSLLGFRQPYCTNARAEEFSAMVSREAEQAGWLVLDGYSMSLLRPDLSLDGMHFGNQLNYMMVQVLLGMVCPA